MLRVEQINVWYGSVQALHSVSLEVKESEIVCLIGANGAGKSTCLRTISGLTPPRSGTISFGGRQINGLAPEDIVFLGISHAPEGRRIFPGLTVIQNLEVGAVPSGRKGESLKSELDRVFELFPILRERRRQLGWSLSGGEQQMLSIGRALMAGPKLLMLDEPSLGLAPRITHELFEVIARVNKNGMVILLVEQNANMALQVAHRCYVLENGIITAAGEAAKIRNDPAVRAAYLGG